MIIGKIKFIFIHPSKSIFRVSDFSKEYTCKELWLFFATRIPSKKQPYHLKKMRKDNIGGIWESKGILYFKRFYFYLEYIIINFSIELNINQLQTIICEYIET